MSVDAVCVKEFTANIATPMQILDAGADAATGDLLVSQTLDPSLHIPWQVLLLLGNRTNKHILKGKGKLRPTRVHRVLQALGNKIKFCLYFEDFEDFERDDL